ncbi:glycosyltransferase involved in cell wall biosynthesis [Diaminobutyricimonas aerilata]|uniref:Glycosyltransferase involved in cell wall biosynthesis n=1 Tax=Diaminobutyricimonas aerilata TaxID=1162967 RepID=A0A2M9CIW0_9MICO|nr:glycosyltransferase family 2 protein [Diaminobutyricimonas aerilata]PJJ71856.1 glycosyltransferase involved in cell wall biosynthesis [Diaminobutyricimonas aerilata]
MAEVTAPDVSVVLPVYNGAEYLDDAVRRLARQEGARIEIVVVDDGSGDDTERIGRALAAAGLVRYFRQPQNAGVAAARERAVREATGEYVWFVDADDRWADDAVATLLGEARRSGADVVVAGAHYVFPDGKDDKPVGSPRLNGPLTAEAAFRAFLRGELTGHLWNKLFRRERALDIIYTRARVHSDQAMVAQLLASAVRGVSVIPDLVYSYLLREGSIIRSGTRRAESLVLVGDAVRDAAGALDPAILASTDYEYYVQRFIVLSALKDATSQSYDDAAARALARQIRRRISLRGLRAVAARRDPKRLALLGAGRFAPPLYRFAMSRGRARA